MEPCPPPMNTIFLSTRVAECAREGGGVSPRHSGWDHCIVSNKKKCVHHTHIQNEFSFLFI